ncbi:MAG TPA: hypothetical protein VNO51_01580 [Ilumatobacteraceae bacterium]|nr:hypothetical protein [Ilumatobacteraceae bacterium]
MTRVPAIVIAVAMTAACDNPWGPDAEELATDSTTDVLVPDDPRFADSWEFTLEEGPDNYTVRSNWDPSYNPDLDRTSVVTGFQIGDPAAWTGAVDAEDEASQAAFVDVLTDSAAPGPGGPCSIAKADPRIVSCSYDVGQVDSLPLLVRRFTTDTGDTTMIIFGATAAAMDYLTGSFTAYPVADAAERWLTS